MQTDTAGPPAASTLRLPPGAWTTVLDCLCSHFAAISRAQWLDRFARGRVLDEHYCAIDAQHPHRVGLTVHYFREVANEPVVPFREAILYVDDHLVVADKPHFLPVMPAGRFVNQTLLARLRAYLRNPDLVPLHRIDRDTAGLVLFSACTATRSRYQALFLESRIAKEYEALAPPITNGQFPHTRSSRIVAGEPFFLMQEAAGAANAHTIVDVLARNDTAANWRYKLIPLTGRKHQLRVHMAALGAPIANDPFYPQLRKQHEDDDRAPLKLLAKRLRFTDPLTGAPREFTSTFAL